MPRRKARFRGRGVVLVAVAATEVAVVMVRRSDQVQVREGFGAVEENILSSQPFPALPPLMRPQANKAIPETEILVRWE